jgi:acyl phosphate:glycerol-3-phosphate acyltransferase
MDLFAIALTILVAYLIGSIPTAVWIGRGYYGIDVREHGSGNAGATNTFRVLGKKAGSLVMLIDVLKGYVATSLALVLAHNGFIGSDQQPVFMLILGITAVIGHIFPVYVNFKGGKGVATLLGMVLALHLQAALICIAVFLIVFLIFRYVSLGSMIAALAFPISLLLPRFSPDNHIVTVFGFILFILIVLTHKKNIKRLINGDESKMNLGFKKPRN